MKSNKGTKPTEFCLQKLWQTLKAKPLASFPLGEMEIGKRTKKEARWKKTWVLEKKAPQDILAGKVPRGQEPFFNSVTARTGR